MHERTHMGSVCSGYVICVIYSHVLKEGEVL